MASNITAKTFPGFYSEIIDRSFLTPQTSRFRAGLVGVARKGAFDTPTAVSSLADFIRIFGQPLSGEFFLANAVAILSDLSDGMKVVRVGKQNTLNAGATVVTTQFSNTGTVLPFAKAAVLTPSIQGGGISTPAVYATITQVGKTSTVNAQVATVGTLAGGYLGQDAGTITFTQPNAIQDLYTAAQLSYSVGAPAANPAESILFAYTYGSNAGSYADAGIFSGPYQLTATGNKGDFQFTLSPASAWALLPIGSLIKITQLGKATTQEARVKQALPDGTVYLETTDRQDIGFQAVPLQDQYSGATISLQTGRIPYLFLQAASAGDWANGGDISTGLFVKVRPGGAPGTKKFEVYENGALQETIDALYNGTGTNSYSGRINGISQEILVVAQAGTVSDMQPANYSFGYAIGAYQINAGVNNTGANFYFGFNGEGATSQDFVGQFNGATEKFTGIQSFINVKNNMQIDVLACPGITDAQAGGNNDFYPWDSTTAEPFATTDTTGVHQMLVQVARNLNALALIDVPPGITARQAIDWHNGVGLYAGRGRINSPNGSVFWNWFTVTDPFTQQQKWVPPTLGALRCLAFTFDRDKPWYAAAGEVRGLIPEANEVEYDTVSDSTRQAMYGNGQSINGIFLDNGAVKLYGERTLQIAESKLSVNHNVILVNYVVNNLGLIWKRFVFEPNDPDLLVRMEIAGKKFLDQVVNERGIEKGGYLLDFSANTPDTRNRREVIVGLQMVPVDSVERIYLTATVRESGAVLNSLNSVTS